MGSNGVSVEMIRLAVNGDPAAVEALLSVAQPDIRRYAKRYCISHEDAEDAAQQTLWQLYRRIGALRTAASFPAWLMMIVRRECSRLASHLKHQSLIEESVLAERSDSELRLDIAAAIESLPERFRLVVILRDLQSKTVDEIGQELSLGREAVKSRLHRARILMREYLAD